jgi:hypothetical protein
MVQRRITSKTLSLIAAVARSFGQFQVAQQLYEEVGDYESLYELFSLCDSRPNPAAPGSPSEFRAATEHLEIPVSNAPFVQLRNLPLPRTVRSASPAWQWRRRSSER